MLVVLWVYCLGLCFRSGLLVFPVVATFTLWFAYLQLLIVLIYFVYFVIVVFIV